MNRSLIVIVALSMALVVTMAISAVEVNRWKTNYANLEQETQQRIPYEITLNNRNAFTFEKVDSTNIEIYSVGLNKDSKGDFHVYGKGHGMTDYYDDRIPYVGIMSNGTYILDVNRTRASNPGFDFEYALIEPDGFKTWVAIPKDPTPYQKICELSNCHLPAEIFLNLVWYQENIMP